MPGPYAAAAHVQLGDLTAAWFARVTGLPVTAARVEPVGGAIGMLIGLARVHPATRTCSARSARHGRREAPVAGPGCRRPSERRGRFRELVELWRSELGRHGVEGYGADAAWRDFQNAALFCLHILVAKGRDSPAQAGECGR